MVRRNQGEGGGQVSCEYALSLAIHVDERVFISSLLGQRPTTCCVCLAIALDIRLAVSDGDAVHT